MASPTCSSEYNLQLNANPLPIIRNPQHILQFRTHNRLRKIYKSIQGDIISAQDVYITPEESDLFTVPHHALYLPSYSDQYFLETLSSLGINGSARSDLTRDLVRFGLKLGRQRPINHGFKIVANLEIVRKIEFVRGEEDDDADYLVDELILEIEELMGISKGALESDLDGLKREKVNGEQIGIECVICLEGLEIGTECIKMPCSHCFHSDCVLCWLKKRKTCPTCRHVLSH